MSKRGSKNAIKFAGRSWSVGGKIKLKANKKLKKKPSKVKQTTNPLSNLLSDEVITKLKNLMKN